MSRLLVLALGCAAAFQVTAQPALQITPVPYDGSGDAPLVIRNVSTAPVSLDSLGFTSRYRDSPGLGIAVELATFDGGQRQARTLFCGVRYRSCRIVDGTGDGPALQRTLAPGDSATVELTSYCQICFAGGDPPLPDTLLLYRAGLPDPVEVQVTGFRMSVASEPGPSDPSVGVAVWPNPASAQASVHLTAPAPVARVTASLHDALGRRLAVLHDGPLAAGVHPMAFDAGAVAPGVYVVQVMVAPDEGAAWSEAVRVTVTR